MSSISKFYDELGQHLNWDGKARDGHMMGSLVLFGTLGGYTLSLLIFIFFLFDKEIDAYSSGMVIAVFGVLSLFFINKKKYEELKERYKDEKYSKLKGWLVFLFAIGSFILYLVAMSLCGYWNSLENW